MAYTIKDAENPVSDFIFIDDLDQNHDSAKMAEKWKVMVVDDDEEVHCITKLVLNNFTFEDKALDIISAYSGAEAIRLICQHPDTAVIFLDVVMEKSDSGLEVVKYIRDALKNKTVRIIIRTGQPGETPEEDAIYNYDINDYKEKSELTSKRLITSVITALRSYRDFTVLENSKKGLEQVIFSSSTILKQKSLDTLSSDFLSELLSVICIGNISAAQKFSGFIASNKNGTFYISSGLGTFARCSDNRMDASILEEEYRLIHKVILGRSFYCQNNYFIAPLINHSYYQDIIFIKNIHPFTDWEKDLLAIYYTNVFVAYDNLVLTEEIESTQKEIVFTLGGIAEARSQETGNHVKRVAEFSKILALGYGLAEEEAEILRQASPMHDIGKIAIPDIILNKPGKLTSEEFDIMKTHSQIGYDMLKNSKRSLMKVASTIALQHHEKYNGSGYPNALREDEIHIYGRITAVADVFDALGCKRVYKEAWELERILALFKEERGKHFDPKLIDVFFENLDTIVHIKNSFTD
ncbi:MAG: DUF3369 domain-containing protein [Clostridia bacterium]|nr:DUF3369 domain-containing protein [Clostridia bacterium]